VSGISEEGDVERERRCRKKVVRGGGSVWRVGKGVSDEKGTSR